MQHLRAEVGELGRLGERERAARRAARATTRGSAVSMPSTSVQIWISSASSPAPNERGGVVRPAAAERRRDARRRWRRRSRRSPRTRPFAASGQRRASRSRAAGRAAIGLRGAVCCASVTSTLRASTQRGRHAARRRAPPRRCGCWPARRSRPIASRERGETSRSTASASQRSPSSRRTARRARPCSSARALRPASTSVGHRHGGGRAARATRRGGAVRVAAARPARDVEQAVGHARQRRHHDDGRAAVSPAAPRRCRRGARSRRRVPTDVPPNFITTMGVTSVEPALGHASARR